MKLETVKSHIDRKIISALESRSFDDVRIELHQACQRFRKRLPNEFIQLNEDVIYSMDNTSSKWAALYVFCAEKRITDLYIVERVMNPLWSNVVKYKALLLKEKIEGGFEKSKEDWKEKLINLNNLSGSNLPIKI